MSGLQLETHPREPFGGPVGVSLPIEESPR
jgi:hypothetical protein